MHVPLTPFGRRQPRCVRTKTMLNREIDMRKYLLATTALLMIGAPAVAKDHSGYVGGDIGAVWPSSQDITASTTFTNTAVPIIDRTGFGSLKYKTGIDADL